MQSELIPILLVAATGGCQGLRDYHPSPRSSGHGGESLTGGRQGSVGGSVAAGAGAAGGGAANGGGSSAGSAAGGAVGGGGVSGWAGAGGDPATGGHDADGGMVGTGGTAIQLPPSICSRAAVAGPPESLGLEEVIDRDATFTAITPSETTLVWTTRQGNNLIVTYLDRPDSDSAFGSPRSTKTDAGDDQVALSPDGLQLVYVSADGQGFQAQTRDDVTAEFAEADTIDFRTLAEPLPDGSRYAEPVYGPEGVSFYFAILDSSGGRDRFLSTRPSLSDSFDRRRPLALPGGDSALAPRVTGVSADQQTLFLWDAETGQTLWSFLDVDTFEYADPTSLGQLGPAQPNATCSRLYAGPALGSIVRLPLD